MGDNSRFSLVVMVTSLLSLLTAAEYLDNVTVYCKTNKYFVCLYRLQAVNPCESELRSNHQDQPDGATLLPLLEHLLEGAHLTLLGIHWRGASVKNIHLTGS